MNQIFEALGRLPASVSLEECLLFFMLIFTRWLVMTTMIPFFGAMLLPSLVRVALAACLSVTCFFVIIDQLQPSQLPDVLTITLLFIKEALIGFVVGFLASLIFYAYELFGQFVDFSRAASMSKLFVPELKQQSSPMGTFLFQLALVVFLALGLHRNVLQTTVASFERFPVLKLSLNLSEQNTIAIVANIANQLFHTAFRFALPVIFVCFLIDLAFGLMNRVAPQINAYFLSLPAKIIGGLLMVLLMLPLLMDDFLDHFHEFNKILLNFLARI